MTKPILDVMTTDLVQVERTVSVADAAKKMRDHDVGDVLVCDSERLVGVLTDRDIVIRCLAEGVDPFRTRVEEVCTKTLATLAPDDDTDRAVEVMAREAVRRLPVVEGGQPRGVVSLGDLAEHLDERSVLAGISAAPPNR